MCQFRLNAMGCEIRVEGTDEEPAGCYVIKSAKLTEGDDSSEDEWCLVFTDEWHDYHYTWNKGHCMDYDGDDQTEGVIQWFDGKMNTQEKRMECLEACIAMEGATACEARWDGDQPGCYIHTAEVDKAGDQSKSACAIMDDWKLEAW